MKLSNALTVFRPREMRADYELAFLPAALEIMETPPSPIGRLLAGSIIAIFCIALGWACLGSVDIITTSTGKIVPSSSTKLIQPYQAQITYLGAHTAAFTSLANGAAKSPKQWQHWFWVDVAGMVVFIPTIWLIGGAWSPGKAKRDEEEHDRAVEEELARILKDDPSPSPA